MLALKTMRKPSFQNEPRTTVQHLPIELLDIIAGYVFEEGFRQTDSLLSFSLVSRSFRQSALPLLFQTVSHVIRDRVDQQEGGVLHALVTKSLLLTHVKSLHIERPVDFRSYVPVHGTPKTECLGVDYQKADLQVIQLCLPVMLRLHRIR
jgi:hypothetical protein